MGRSRDSYDRRNRWLWMGLAAPGAIWLLVLFVAPFYVMLAVAGGGVNSFFQTAIQSDPSSPIRDWYSFNPDGSYRFAFGFQGLPDNNQNNAMVRQTLMQEVTWFMDRGLENVRCDIAGFTPPSFWRAIRRQGGGRRRRSDSRGRWVFLAFRVGVARGPSHYP